VVNIGLIGAGRIGTVHAGHLLHNPHGKIVAVTDPQTSRATALAAEHGARVAKNADEIIAAKDIDAVIVASSTETHSPTTIAAVRAGKCAYCEKPIAPSLTEAKKMVDALGSDHVRVMVGFNRRFDRNHAAVQRDIAAGRLGHVQTVQITSRGPNNVPSVDYLKVSGGLFFDKMIHFFDMVRWLTGEEPVDIVALGSVIADEVFRDVGDVDTAVATVRMKSGALCQIDNARRAVYGYDDRVEVFGTKGLIESSRITEGSIMRILDDKILTEGLPKDPMIRMAPSYEASISAFVDFVGSFATSERLAVPTVHDGIRSQIMAEAATRSARERRIVSIAEVEKLIA